MDSQKSKITELVNALIEGTDIFLIKITVSATKKISVYLDADSGLSIDKCVRLNRALYKNLVEQGVYEDGEFGLEVSSPGLDEPLVLHRQYLKNIERLLHITLEDAVVEGRLKAVEDESIKLEVAKDKKTKEIIDVALSSIKETKILIEFKN